MPLLFVLVYAGTVTCVGRLVDVLDKKSGAVIIVDSESVTRVVYTSYVAQWVHK